MVPDDDALVAAARAGDLDAFGSLIERHRVRALRVAYTVAGADAEDAVQEACVKAYRALHRFREGARFSPWFLAIVANEARNRRRSAARRTAIELRVAGRRGDDPRSPEDDAVLHERRDRLAAALGALGDRDRTVIALRYFAGLSEAETAEALGCAIGTAKSRLSRALERLRVEVGEEVVS